MSCCALEVVTATRWQASPTWLWECHAERLIFTWLERTNINWIIVKLKDLETGDGAVYKSNMSWPNNEEDIVYICVGLVSHQAADRRCLLQNMTVAFTGFYKEYNMKHGLVMLPVIRFNEYLDNKAINRKTKYCDSACAGMTFVKWWLPFILGIPLLITAYVLIEKKCNCCQPNTTTGNLHDSSVRPETSSHGELPC